jgi:hypothetical protein
MVTAGYFHDRSIRLLTTWMTLEQAICDQNTLVSQNEAWNFCIERNGDADCDDFRELKDV